METHDPPTEARARRKPARGSGPAALRLAAAMIALGAGTVAQSGSIRGVVYDGDFDAPLPAALVLIVETDARTTTSDQGNYAFPEVDPGTYTLVFSKEGYVRQVRAGVVVTVGRLTDVDASLTGEFTEMEEFIVRDILIGTGTEAALLELRFESPSFLDSISAELMSRAGASDAASALTLVSGATVQDGKFAVIRGLPDRYVSAQMNGVRLPTADEDKRAVELDQFPAAVIESIQVSKTFTPDQQGDASGGAVDVRLKSIPEETFVEFKTQVSGNSQAFGRDDFLTYDGGGVGPFGLEAGEREVQMFSPRTDWSGAVGVEEGDAPLDSKWSFAAGGKRDLDDGVRIGGFASIFYERDSSYHDNGVDDSYWVETPGAGLVPVKKQNEGGGNFKTSLLDITQGSKSVQWGGLGTLGVESENNKLGLTYLFTHSAEDVATLSEDTRGKEHFFPGYDKDDPDSEGNQLANLETAPYTRQETLTYTERETSTLQLHGEHALQFLGFEIGDAIAFAPPELDWTLANSSASLDQPDKRQFGTFWRPEKVIPPIGPFPGSTTPATYFQLKPDNNVNLGNLQRIYKTIEEQSDQTIVNLRLPFGLWNETEGYMKFGWFDDEVARTFDQESFNNAPDANIDFEGEWEDSWSSHWSEQEHLIGESLFDVDYEGDQHISAYYAMVDIPLGPRVNLIGGYRWESTQLAIANSADSDATWYPPETLVQTALTGSEADVDFEQQDVLPAIAIEYRPTDKLTLRGSYTATVARQTFKELTPVLQQEYLGGPIFIGNPDLQMSALKNKDFRVDYEPYEGGLISASWFQKDVMNPIEYVQRIVEFTFTTAVNYPQGELSGYELELRQDLGRLWEPLEGLSAGANATFIESEVTLPDDEQADLAHPNIQAPMSTRDMTNAPEHLYNLYLTYDIPDSGTQAALFYTVRGDMLVAGAGVDDNNFVPSIYEREYGTLNFSLSQELGERSRLQFQAKNLTNPEIQEVYRSDYIDGDTVRTSYTRGMEFSITYTIRF